MPSPTTPPTYLCSTKVYAHAMREEETDLSFAEFGDERVFHSSVRVFVRTAHVGGEQLAHGHVQGA